MQSSRVSPQSRPQSHPSQASRRRLALAAALLVPLALLSPTAAQAKPVLSPPRPGQEGLAAGVLIDLTPGARNIQVDESSAGGSVAVSWTVRNAKGTDELWARVKRGTQWGARVRVSDPAVSATRPDMDLDSDGSLLLAWAETRGKARTLVARRLSGSSLAAPKVLKVTAADGPYVAAGPLHDVIAWTAVSGGLVRPFASVDVGGGFPNGVAVSSAGWKRPVIDGTLAVNADGQQVHVSYLSRDAATSTALASWSVLETPRTTAWAFWDGLGPTQRLERPLRPQIGVDNRNVAALVFSTVSEQDGVRYPLVRLYDPKLAGSAKARLSDSRSLEVPDGSGVRTVDGVRNRRGVLVAAYDTTTGLPALLKQITRPTESGFFPYDWNALASCAPYGQWFFTWHESQAEMHCIDDESTPGRLNVLFDQGDPTDPAYTLRPDTALTGSLLRSAVPDPLVSLIAITEDLPGTSNDPVWLLDYTEGGSDKAATPLKMVRTQGPSIVGKPVVGRTLTARSGLWRPSPAKVTYRWYAGKKAIKGATKPTLRLTKKMKGKKISVRLQVSRSGYRTEALTVVRAQKVKAKPKKKKRK